MWSCLELVTTVPIDAFLQKAATQTGKLLQPWYDKAEDAFCTECEYNVHTSIHILEQPVMGCYCLLLDVCRLGTEKHLSSTTHPWNEVTTDWQHNTPAHRHNTGGFGTPMLVLLLCIFNKTHSCRTLPPLWGKGCRLSTDLVISGHIQSTQPISSSRLSSKLGSCGGLGDRKAVFTGVPVAVVTLRRVLARMLLVAGLRSAAAAVMLVKLMPRVSRVCSKAFSGTAKASSFFSPFAM